MKVHGEVNSLETATFTMPRESQELTLPQSRTVRNYAIPSLLPSVLGMVPRGRNERSKVMASKLFNSTKALAIANGMTPSQAHYLARMASGHATEVGLGEVSIDDVGAKSTSKGFTTTVKSAVKRDLKKGELLNVGEVAFLFACWLRDSAKAWPSVLRNVSLPTGLTSAYVEAIRKEAEEATKKAKAHHPNSAEVGFEAIETAYAKAWEAEIEAANKAKEKAKVETK